jgi:hypothetical protein
MQYLVAKVYNVEYAHKLTNMYMKLYGHTLITETSSYSVNNIRYLEIRVYTLEPHLHDVQTTLCHLHEIYGRGDRLSTF